MKKLSGFNKEVADLKDNYNKAFIRLAKYLPEVAAEINKDMMLDITRHKMMPGLENGIARLNYHYSWLSFWDKLKVNVKELFRL